MTMQRASLGTLVCLCLALPAWTACGGDDDGATVDARGDGPPPVDAPLDGSTTHPDLPDTLPSPLPAGDVSLKVVTFNAGLLSLVKAAPERIAPIQAALEALDADVVCLNEIFTQFTTIPEFAAQLADVYPHAWYQLETDHTMGSGLLIVSKKPLYRGRALRFTTNDPLGVVDRAVIAATVVDANQWVNVMCTHIQAGLDTSGREARAAQLAELDQFVTAQGYATQPTILLGDFNTGPDPMPDDTECSDEPSCSPTCLAADTTAYDAMRTTYGWTDPTMPLGVCTSCREQFVQMATVNLFACDPSQRIDHCFVRNLGTSQVTSITRELDDPVTITGMGGTAMYLSDHYAVRCAID